MEPPPHPHSLQDLNAEYFSGTPGRPAHPCPPQLCPEAQSPILRHMPQEAAPSLICPRSTWTAKTERGYATPASGQDALSGLGMQGASPSSEQGLGDTQDLSSSCAADLSTLWPLGPSSPGLCHGVVSVVVSGARGGCRHTCVLLRKLP